MFAGLQTRKPCKWCGEVTHPSWKCYQKPRPTNGLRGGKYSKQWLITRRTWFRQNPPNEEGFYECYICGVWMLPKETTLDHVKSRSRHPELRFTLSNLKPCCAPCNEAKGSKELKDIMEAL